ncbi:helix-turn-helix domain-containing protein [Nocardia tengchongensis]|uniref:helix-turn-helix domain-containing protein n=1 Tax=Nocardia tengchongensis TaxID=2055889 RepID=UPI00364B7C60
MKPQQLTEGTGARIKIYRLAADLTQPQLATAIGKSVPWLKQIENGQRYTDRLTDLQNIADVVGCSLNDLLSHPIDSLAPGVRPRADLVTAVRDAMLRVPVYKAPPGTVSDLDDMGTRVAEAWTIWHDSPTAHRSLGNILPNLILDATAQHQIAGDGDKRVSARILTGTWQVTRQWLHHVPDADLAWVAADRAMSNAQKADDPRLIALGAWALSASYRRAGQQDAATQLCLDAAEEVNSHIDTSNPQKDLLAAFGMLNLAASISAAQSDEDGRAWALHRVAEDTANTLGGHIDPWTMFGRANVDIHGLALRAEFGDADAVVEYGHRLDLDQMPSVERRSRALIDTARGLVRRGEDEGAMLVLIDAERISQDEVHHSGLVQDMLRELLHRDRARARPHVREMAKRCGVLRA